MTANTLATTMLNEVICTYGLYSDQGINLCNNVVYSLYQLFEIYMTGNLAFYPESNGLALIVHCSLSCLRQGLPIKTPGIPRSTQCYLLTELQFMKPQAPLISLNFWLFPTAPVYMILGYILPATLHFIHNLFKKLYE